MLHVIGGNDRGKSHPLTKPETAIGRGADQDCILADIAVSRRHVVIAIEGARYRLRDLGSGNGSLLNGTRTDTAILNDGDQIEIGNTLLRFEHAPSRPMTGAMPASGAPLRADAAAHTMMADAVQYPAPPSGRGNPTGFPAPAPVADFPPQQPAMPVEPIQMPPPVRPMTSALPAPLPTGMHAPAGGGGLLDSTAKKVAVFGTIGLVVVLGAAVVVKKVVFAGPNAQELFDQGKRAYVDGNYDIAKKLFAESATQKPDAEATKYLKQCDVEIHARAALKTAQGMMTAKQWDQALKTLDTIDKSAAAYEDAEKLKKTAVPNAVAALLNDARQNMDDAESAKEKVASALELDPDNEEAQELDRKLAGGKGGDEKQHEAKPAHEAAAARPAHETHQTHEQHPVQVAAVKERAPATGSKPAGTRKPAASDDDDDELASVGGAGDVLSVKGAAGPYKAKDFNGAAAAVRAGLKGPKGADLATKIALLAGAYNKA